MESNQYAGGELPAYMHTEHHIQACSGVRFFGGEERESSDIPLTHGNYSSSHLLTEDLGSTNIAKYFPQADLWKCISVSLMVNPQGKMSKH